MFLLGDLFFSSSKSYSVRGNPEFDVLKLHLNKNFTSFLVGGGFHQQDI